MFVTATDNNWWTEYVILPDKSISISRIILRLEIWDMSLIFTNTPFRQTVISSLWLSSVWHGWMFRFRLRNSRLPATHSPKDFGTVILMTGESLWMKLYWCSFVYICMQFSASRTQRDCLVSLRLSFYSIVSRWSYGLECGREKQTLMNFSSTK